MVNKLSLNLKKTKFMIFKPRQKRQRFDTQLSINNQIVSQVTEILFLGVVLDENLSWKSHISHISNKISKSVGIIFRASFYLTRASLRTLYFSMVYPYLQYCNIVWASTYSINLRRIVVLQKRIIRILNTSKFDAHTDPICRDLHLLKFHDICKLQMEQFVFSCKNKLVPKYFNHMFVFSSQPPNYNTRNRKSLRIPFCRTKLRQFSTQYQGSKFYNSLPDEIINTASFSSFTVKLKRYLCSEYGNMSAS